MKIIKNSIIPFPGYKAIAILCYIFTRTPERITETDINHESIHWEQQKELLIIGFYLWYVIEWIVRFFLTGFDGHKAYRQISFEQEAYSNEDNLEYNSTRRHYGWLKYFK